MLGQADMATSLLPAVVQGGLSVMLLVAAVVWLVKRDGKAADLALADKKEVIGLYKQMAEDAQAREKESQQIIQQNTTAMNACAGESKALWAEVADVKTLLQRREDKENARREARGV